MLKLTFITCMALLQFSVVAYTENKVSTKLLSNVETAEPGAMIRVGVVFDLPPRSHIYWRNPGESGFATGLEWSVDDAVEVGDLQWPVPKQFEVEGLDESYFGYTNETLLFSEVTVPKTAAVGDKLTIRVKAHWLLCLDDGVCIPEDAELSLEIPVHAESRKAYESTLFSRYAETVPEVMDKVNSPLTVSWKRNSPELLEIALAEGWALAKSTRGPRFFPGLGGPWIPEISSGKVAFRPKYTGEEINEGILSVSMEEKTSGERSTYNLRVSMGESP